MSSQSSYKQLILVDDDPLVHFMIKKHLEIAQISIPMLSFYNGLELFEFTSDKSSSKSLILLDLSMPIASGWDFLESFRKLSKVQKDCFRIYIISSSIDPNDLERVKEYDEVIDFLPKPITDKTLIKILV